MIVVAHAVGAQMPAAQDDPSQLCPRPGRGRRGERHAQKGTNQRCTTILEQHTCASLLPRCLHRQDTLVLVPRELPTSPPLPRCLMFVERLAASLIARSNRFLNLQPTKGSHSEANGVPIKKAARSCPSS